MVGFRIGSNILNPPHQIGALRLVHLNIPLTLPLLLDDPIVVVAPVTRVILIISIQHWRTIKIRIKIITTYIGRPLADLAINLSNRQS